MFEKPNRKSGIPTAFDLTNASLRLLGKGLGKAAKAGYEAYANVERKKYEESALNDIHSIIFAGALPTPGHPLPVLRTTPLNADELKRFTQACNGLIDRKIALPGYVTNFAARFYIRLKS